MTNRIPPTRRWFTPLTLSAVLAAGMVYAGEISRPAKPVSAPARQQVAPGQRVTKAVPKFDYTGIGGVVYATGLGEVVATVVPVQEFLSDEFYPYLTVASLRTEDREVVLGSNREKKTFSLGKLPRGEMHLVVRCPDGGYPYFESGPGERNTDGQPHSRVRMVAPGVVEVYFEITMEEGTRSDRTEQHWYKDYKVVFTGAVTADSNVVFLLNRLQDPDPVTRDTARRALKELSPKLARQAGVR